MLNIDVPEDLKRRLEAEAERDMRSQRAVTILALEAYLKEREQASEPNDKIVACDTKDETRAESGS